jgi:hypothetical protein
LGGFDEQLETCEDVDLCRRLLIAGKRLVEDPRLVNVHHGDPRTLRAVFLGELWRGRDNLRVTFRRPLEIRSVLSAIQPATTLVAVATLLTLAVVSSSLWWLVAAATFVLAASVPRWVQMMSRANTMAPGTWFKCASVAVAFDLGRAAALVARASHSWRGGSSPLARGVSKP